MFGINFFNNAGATGNVFLLSGGKPVDKGLAYSGFVYAGTTIAVVPTTPMLIDFGIDALTSDKQRVTVAGNIKVSFEPAKAMSKFDFTVDA